MDKLINLITQYSPFNEQEIADKKLFLDCINKYDNVLTRENLLCHFTASAFVINKEKTKVVGAYHNIYKSWSWLGGHADGDADLLHVAKKEVEEESGLTKLQLFNDTFFSLESLPVLGHFKKGKFVPAHVHLNVTYVFVADEKEKLRIKPDENCDIAWLTFQELINKNSEKYMIDVYHKIIDKLKLES